MSEGKTKGKSKTASTLAADIDDLLECAYLDRDDRDSVANARVSVVSEIARAARVRAQAKHELRDAQRLVVEAKDSLRATQSALSKRYRAELFDAAGKRVTEGMIQEEVEADKRWVSARDELRAREIDELDAQRLDDLAYGMWAALQAKQAMAASLAADHRAEISGDFSSRREAREAREERELERELGNDFGLAHDRRAR